MKPRSKNKLKHSPAVWSITIVHLYIFMVSEGAAFNAFYQQILTEK